MIYYQIHKSKQNSTKANIPLVLLHSGGMTGAEWQPQLAQFNEDFDVITLDLPAHGNSVGYADDQLTISMMAKSIIEVLDHEKITKVNLLGSSMGGAVALWIALNYPQYLNKLIVYRISYRKNPENHAHTLKMADPDYWRQFGLHNLLSKYHIPQGGVNDGADAWKKVIANVSKILDPKTSEHSHSLTDLEKITCPTLLITGDQDPIAPIEDFIAMQQHIGKNNLCGLWIIPFANHVTASNTWRSKAFADEVIKFLKTK